MRNSLPDTSSEPSPKDALFDDKVELLALYYPQFLTSALSDLLISCESDIDAVRGILSGNAPRKRPALNQGNLGGIKLQKTGTESNRSDSTFTKTTKGNRAKVVLNTPDDVERYLAPYASIHLNFLPKETCETLLSDLMERKSSFKYNQFYLFGNRCELSHLLGMFARPEAAYAQLVYNGLKRSKPAAYTESMEKAAVCLEKLLNDVVIPNESPPRWNINATNDEETYPQNYENNKQSHDEAHFDDPHDPVVKEKSWTSDFCLVNCYEKLHNNLAWHSDRLSHIGPLNYVASLSLGSTRIFRLRNIHNKNTPTFHIPLPHNSVLLMKPGCQEEFQHCVESMSKAIALHEKVGTLRFGITARHYPPFFIENLPKCKCNLGMILRRSYKNIAIRGQYFWSCENIYQNKDCGAFHWCDFNNVSGHYIASDKSKISTWIAPEDHEKWEYERKRRERDNTRIEK